MAYQPTRLNPLTATAEDCSHALTSIRDLPPLRKDVIVDTDGSVHVAFDIYELAGDAPAVQAKRDALKQLHALSGEEPHQEHFEVVNFKSLNELAIVTNTLLREEALKRGAGAAISI